FPTADKWVGALTREGKQGDGQIEISRKNNCLLTAVRGSAIEMPIFPTRLGRGSSSLVSLGRQPSRMTLSTGAPSRRSSNWRERLERVPARYGVLARCKLSRHPAGGVATAVGPSPRAPIAARATAGRRARARDSRRRPP